MRQLLLALADNHRFKIWCTQFPPTRRLAHRFVAGESLQEALPEVKTLNEQGIAATLDHLGEHVKMGEEANNSAELYLEILDEIDRLKLDCNVSLKLTQMGLALDEEVCYENVARVVEHAARSDNFVRIDMEGSPFTDQTLDIYRRLRNAGHTNVGAVVQAYLYRSQADIEQLIPLGLNIRLCKGAYAEPSAIAFAKKSDVDENFISLLRILLTKESLKHGTHVGIATHDESIITAAKELIRTDAIPLNAIEFQMLYGIRRDLQLALAREGFRVRVYVSFGQEWYPYFMRRLAERPANLLFLMKNLFRE